MHFKQLSLAVLASAVAVHAQTLSSILASTPNLSNLTAYLSLYPNVVAALFNAENVTFLAPNNDAFTKFLSTPEAEAALNDTELITAVFFYHVLQGIHMTDSITGVPSFVSTDLMNSSYTGLSMGQVVEAVVPADDKTTIFSGLLTASAVVEANITFSGGVIHIIDTLLTIPQNISVTLIELNLTAAAGALEKASADSAASLPTNLTAFIPNNEAFQMVDSVLQNISIANLSLVLGYHIIPDLVLYSTDLKNGTLMSADGIVLNINVSDVGVTVNNAKVVIPNVLVAEGVVHVIDQVLNPGNISATGDSPAFAGANSAGAVPFTSGIPAPSSTVATSGAGAATATFSSAASGGAKSPSSSISGGAIAGIVIGVIGLILLSVVIWLLLRRRSSHREPRKPPPIENEKIPAVNQSTQNQGLVEADNTERNLLYNRQTSDNQGLQEMDNNEAPHRAELSAEPTAKHK